MLNPWMLLGLIGLAIPVIIHLIQRQKLQPRQLATLRFLEQTDVANAFAPVPRDILQLVLRLILLAVFILLMVRITVPEPSGRPGARALAIILDSSMSMKQTTGLGPEAWGLRNGSVEPAVPQASGLKPPACLFDVFRQCVANLIADMGPDDQICVMIADDEIRLDTGFLRDPAALQDALDKATAGAATGASDQAAAGRTSGLKPPACSLPSDAGGRAVLPAIRRTLHRLQTMRHPNTFVLVFSDHQLINYNAEWGMRNAESGTALPGTPNSERGTAVPASRELADIRSLLRHGRAGLLLVTAPDAKQPNAEAETPQPGTGDAEPGTAAIPHSAFPIPHPNVAVHDATFSPPRAYLGSGAKITAVIANHSAIEQDAEITLIEGTASGETRPLHLAPREAARMDLVHSTCSEPEDTPCAVKLETRNSKPETAVAPQSDVLPADDTFRAPLRVRDRCQVLLVTPPERLKPEPAAMQPAAAGGTRANAEAAPEETLPHSGPDLLAYAINPGEALGTGAGTNVNVKRITPNLLQKVPLPLYSVVILYGIAELPDQSIADLTAYVQGGGGLWLIPTPDISPARFNDSYTALLAGMRLGAWRVAEGAPIERRGRGAEAAPAERSGPGTLDPLLLDTAEGALTDPVLLPLVRGEWGDIQDVSFSSYNQLAGRGDTRCALAARANAECLIATFALGRGAVCVQAFPFDPDQTTLLRSTVFVPLVQQLLDELAGAAAGESAAGATDTIRVGDAARMEFPELRSVSGPVSFALRPDAGRPAVAYEFPLLPAEPAGRPGGRAAGGPPAVQIADIACAGIYKATQAQKPGMRARWLAVNPIPAESDLTAIGSEAEAKEIFGPARVAVVPCQALRASEAKAYPFSRRREVLPIILAALFGAFVIEALAAAFQSARAVRRNPHRTAVKRGGGDTA